MDEWISGACDQVDRLAARGGYYQELEKQLRWLEPAYEAVLNKLSETDRETILEVEYLLSEMAYQKMQVAYRYGRGLRKE